MRSPFEIVGNVPFDLSVLQSIFPDCKHITDKARSLEAEGRIVRLKNGLYVASQQETDIPISRELVANHLYGPSYVSWNRTFVLTWTNWQLLMANYYNRLQNRAEKEIASTL